MERMAPLARNRSIVERHRANTLKGVAFLKTDKPHVHRNSPSVRLRVSLSVCQDPFSEIYPLYSLR